MANLQQCLLQSSVQRSSERRRRRKRNKKKKVINRLNNSIIHEFSRQLYKTGSNEKNLFRFDPPGRSEVNQSFEKSALNQTIDLCSDDSTNETINCINDDKPCMISQQKGTLIDLSSHVADEVEIIILSNDESKPPESKSPCATPCENKFPDAQSSNTKSSNAKSANNTPRKSVILHTRLEKISFPSKPPDTQSLNLKSLNAKSTATTRPSKGVLLHSKPENKIPLSKPLDIQSPNSKSHNGKAANNTFPKRVILHNRPEDKSPLSKLPDAQLPNFNSTNTTPATNRPSKALLLHSRPEDKSPSTLPDSQSPNLKSPNAEGASDGPSKIVPDEVEIIILPNDESKLPESKIPCTTPNENKPEAQSPNSKSPIAKSANSRPKCAVLHSRPENKSPLSKSSERKFCITPPEYEHPKDKPVHNRPPKSIILDSRPQNKSPPSTLPDSQSPNLKSPNAEVASNRPSKIVPDEVEILILPNGESKLPESKIPCTTPHENKPPDVQFSNSNSTNIKSTTNRPSEAVLLHSKPEDKSPLSKSLKRKCVTPPEYEHPKAKPATKELPKCVVLDSKPQDKSPLSKPPEKKRCITPSEDEQSNAKPLNNSPPASKSETVVIDITDDGSEADVNLSEKNDTNDEILVIGTFNKTSKSIEVPSKKPSKKIHKKLTKGQTRKLRKEQPRDIHTEHGKELPKSCTKECPKENLTQGFHKAVRRQGAFDFAEPSSGNSNMNIVKLRRRIKARYFNKMLQYKKKMEVDLFDTIKYQHLLINNKLSGTELANGVGGNVYINSPVYIPTSGLRPIMIDGSNVAFTSENQYKFSCKRLDICIKYFKEKGHKVTAFVPQYRVQSHQSDNPGLLDQLVRSGDVVLTPSKVIDGKLIVPYDDRFIVQAAVLKGGIIISRDNYKDLLEENPTWAETIKYRTLAYTWVDDVLMFPNDPLGVIGPSLEEFLRFN